MAKGILKGVGIFLFLVAVAVISWLTSYFVTTKVNEEYREENPPSYAVFAQEDEEATNTIKFEYYIVRLEDNTLKVYTCADNSEEFLYSEKIITSNLTKTDIELLERGTVLYTTAQLTEFMENFVS
ncbi:MAG: hypothetical protein IKC07_00700 [Clostridia bacterium]|nr:hypothetical protein [Clostridia bacterium]